MLCCCLLLYFVICNFAFAFKCKTKCEFIWLDGISHLKKKNQNIKRSNDSNINSDSSLMLLLFFMLLVNDSFSEIFICEKLKVPTHNILCCAERILTHSLCLCLCLCSAFLNCKLLFNPTQNCILHFHDQNISSQLLISYFHIWYFCW